MGGERGAGNRRRFGSPFPFHPTIRHPLPIAHYRLPPFASPPRHLARFFPPAPFSPTEPYPMSLLDMVQQQLGGGAVDNIAQQIGADPQQTRSAIDMAL